MIVKPGYKTTELLAGVLAATAVWIDSLAGSLPDRYAALASAIVAGLYGVSRGLTKHGAYLGAAKATPGVVAPPATPQPPPPPTGNVEG